MESKAKQKIIQVQTKKSENVTKILKQSFDFIGFFGKLIGWKCCYEWKKNNPRFWLAMIIYVYAWSQILHTQFKCFIRGEHRKNVEVFALYGISISCSLKIRCFLKYFKEMTALNSFIYKITRIADTNTFQHLIRRQICNLKTYKLIALMEIAALLIFSYHPIKSYIFDHKLVSLLPIEIMFIDQTEVSGFFIANCVMSIMGLYAMSGCLFLDLQFYSTILNYSFQVDLIEYDIKELDALWANPAKSSLSERYLLLRNICQKCQDKDNYIYRMKKIFDQTIYLYFVAVYISQIICLYEIETENWIPGYGITCGIFTEMLLHCLFGTKTTIINERLCYILTQSNWYTYDMYSQKQFLILQNSCMNAKELWIGPLAPLSVITGTQILKSIYSYYTFLATTV